MLVEQSRHLATPVCEAASGDARARSTRVVAERAAARRAHIDPGREDDSGVVCVLLTRAPRSVRYELPSLGCKLHSKCSKCLQANN